jgi:trans-aconitate methyltransferase
VADWARYYAWSADREPRPLLLEACRELGPGARRQAIDLGCGSGTEALTLLDHGWSVLALDAEEAALAMLGSRVPSEAADRLQLVRASFTEAELPAAALIHAGFSLPFCPPGEFGALWARIRAALVPGGIVAVQLFGVHDSWAGEDDMTFHTRAEAEALLGGMDVIRLEETEREGRAYSGPKHWHLFDVLARRAEIVPMGDGKGQVWAPSGIG